MANKEFIARNGLIVGSNVFVVNASTNTVSAVGTINASAIQVNGTTIPSGATSNLVFDTVNTAFNVANAAFGSANNVAPQVAPAFNTANDAYTVANASYTFANGVATNTTAAFTLANGVFSNAAAGFGFANGVATNTTAAFEHSNLTYAAVNSAFGVINAAYTQSNSEVTRLSAAYVVANAAYGNANNLAVSANAYSGAMANSVNSYTSLTYVKLTAGQQTITGDLNVTGNLTFLGNSTVVSSGQLSVGDSLIYLASNNYSGTDLVDIGFIANYGNTTGANVHTGLVRDATDKQYYLFSGYDAEPANNTFVPGGNNMVNAVLVADLNTSNLTLGSANAILWITASYDKANSANILAYNTGIGANNYAGAMANSANAYATATYATQSSVSTGLTSANNYAGDMANSANAVAATKVASVTGTAGQIFSSGGTTPTINLISTGVTATTYGGATQIPVIAVDAYGRLTSASNVAVSGMDYPYVNTSTAAANNWANTKVAAVTSNGSGRLWANTVTDAGGTETVYLDLATSGVTAQAYTGGISAITVDAYGRVTAATGSAGYVTSSGVTSVAAGTGLSGGTITSTGTISMPNVGPGAGSYSSGISAITLDAQGRVTAITGSAGYLTGITSGQVTTALGYTPYNSTNPSGYITSSALTPYAPLAGATFTGLIIGAVPSTSGVGGGNDTGSMSIRGDGTRSAHVSFHRTGAYAINMGLDTDNVFRIGGWSDGGSSFRMQLSAPGGTHTFNGTVAATIFNSTSDINKKENIQPILGAIESINKINGYTFNWKYNGNESIGVIAQEVEKILPCLVDNNEEGKSVNYNGLVAMLIEVVKQQQKDINELKNKIK